MMKRAALSLALALATTAVADEGMWTPDQLPEIGKQLKAKGLKLEPERLADLTAQPLNAVISLGGCTASFLSPDGLVSRTITARRAPSSTTRPRRRTFSRMASSQQTAPRSCSRDLEAGSW